MIWRFFFFQWERISRFSTLWIAEERTKNLSHSNNSPSNQFTINLFSTTNWFMEVLLKVYSAQWGNLQLFPPRFLSKNFVKLNILLKSYTVNQFHEKYSQWGKISEISTLCSVVKIKEFTLTEEISREINSLGTSSEKRSYHDTFIIKVWE